MQIEEDPNQLEQLRIISQEHGIGYNSSPVFVGTPESIVLFNESESSVDVMTGFGRFTMRKRNGIWVGYKRIGEQVREFSAGKSEDITTKTLNDLAIRLYG